MSRRAEPLQVKLPHSTLFLMSALHCPFSRRFPIAPLHLLNPAVLMLICLPRHPLEVLCSLHALRLPYVSYLACAGPCKQLRLAHLGIQFANACAGNTRFDWRHVAGRQHLSPRLAFALASAVRGYCKTQDSERVKWVCGTSFLATTCSHGS
jgi:hypothetical protein